MKKQPKVRIDIAAMLAFAWLLFAERSVYGWLSFFAAALHEIGHWGAARFLNLPLTGFSFGLFGARIDIGAARVLSYREELLLAAAGPMANLLTALAAWGILRCTGEKSPILESLMFFIFASLLLAAVNLFPIRSLDGGRILECLAAQLFGDRAAVVILQISTCGFAVFLFVMTALLWLRAAQNLSLLVLTSALLVRVAMSFIIE
ncbi:MAG: hypothetical protein IKL84_03240 [Clostridia bacterium]|nr:hypothetical protein [Clostridia bacterium]